MIEAVQEEVKRLGVEMDPWKMGYFDFYRNMIAAMKETYGDTVIMMKVGSDVEDFYQGMYLACLLLFEKPGYMDVPVAAHFAQKEAVRFLRSAIYIPLDKEDMEKLEALRDAYGGIEILTNPEMKFVLSIYEKAMK
ncbi:MAG: hypothetical protein LBB61_10590 [Treponema sp.]|nr:hypothetical protein [Treponema sp.]